MTRAQERAVEAIKRAMLDYGNVELKRWEVYTLSPDSNTIVVTAEIGMPGDEGTPAEFYCRNHAHVFIGTRGGIRAVIGDCLRRIEAWQAPHLKVYERQAAERQSKGKKS